MISEGSRFLLFNFEEDLFFFLSEYGFGSDKNRNVTSSC